MTDATQPETLIVDDEAGMRVVLERFVSALGHRVHVCRSGTAAIELLERGVAIDVVLSDIKMPGMNGVELLRELKLLRPGIEVVLFTGYAGLEVALEAIQLGVSDMIIKPFKLERLGQAADAYLAEEPRWGEAPTRELDELELNLLRALGYALP